MGGFKPEDRHPPLAEWERLAGWIKAETQQGLSADTSFAIQLCLEEAVANIIMYGGAKDDRLKIAIGWSAIMLVARIEETGREFDPTPIPVPVGGKVARGGESGRSRHPPDA
jgi:hypothetical protein